MFESISRSFQDAFRKLAGKARLSEKNIEEGIVEVRRALLQADVNYKVVRDFIQKVKNDALGEKVIRGVEPHQQFIKILHDRLVDLMGPVDHDIPCAKKGPTILMLVGLQGSGKTTTVAKLAKRLEKEGRKPLMAACDLIRPAAVEQLRVLGRQIGIPVHAEEGGRPIKVARRAVAEAEETGRDTVLIDTQGRLHVDDELMDELVRMKEKLKPHRVYLVLDSMTGQDAVNSARQFNDRVGIDAVILTKLDGDARGGCALSVKAVTGKPIQFVGVGEKIQNLEPFHPDRMASRILGMGDVVGLVERAQAVVDREEAVRMKEQLLKGEITFEDMLKQMKAVQKMGRIQDIVKMIPGMSQVLGDQEIDENEIKRTEAIIQSMTPEERRNPELLFNISRKQRISRGCGVRLHEVNAFIRQFGQLRQMFRDLGRGKGRGDFFQKLKAKKLI